MGVTISRAHVDYYNKKRRRANRGSVLLVGLDGAGKSTATYQLALGKHVDTLPTMGHNKQSFRPHIAGAADARKWDLFDVGGSLMVRETWPLYAAAADAIIVVVDSTRTDRMGELKKALEKMYATRKIDVPVLVLANKEELPGAVEYHKVAKMLDIESMTSGKTLVLPTNSVTGEGLLAGFMWITENVGSHGRH
eukprot:CAMPEP_0184719256 /NCGR_PEP_ID=MMETSP0314-20130426/8229_1 /TAXON_ID=38298 /ORGANISM="Rhodella maculata, Strain CCMP 736" /LENGTH=193 /DNA_ID=CAMNT_0027183117 /DNA_START=424 /DNA_END=1005 /DNA_ORIENTATION=+